MTEQTVIQATDLGKIFGDFTAVDAVSFEVYKGEIFGFLGPNGSGKTTTIRMMLGLMKPSAGSVEILGKKVDGNTGKIRQHLGYMSQRFSLYNDLSVLQNLQFYSSAYGIPNAEQKGRIQETLALAGLTGREHTRTRELSGGWRQRLALGAAVLHRPKLLFLDEPTAGVDPLSRRAFWDLLYKLVAEGITVFVTTHYMDEAEHCHRLAFIQHGRLIAYGSPAQIKTNMMHGQVLEMAPSDAVQAVKVLRLAREKGDIAVDEIELYGSLVHIVAADLRRQQYPIRSVLRKAGIQPGRVSIIEPSLEDVFIACMKSS
ncbi:MAG: ABC transporter ATP-binding protein [Chloroflexota bacterium]